MSRRRKKGGGEEEGGEAWLLPYSDLMTLLLAVFIVLFAVSQIDTKKAEDMAKSFQGIFTGGTGNMEGDGTSVIPLYPGETQAETQAETQSSGQNETQSSAAGNGLIGTQDLNNLEGVRGELNDYLKQNGLASSVSTHIDERGLVITLDNAILFDSGSAEIKPANETLLLKIASIINKLDNYIRIEGHTDNRPISTAVYPSNWELSAARASRVVRLYVEKSGIDPEKMVAVGYAEFKPVATNDTEVGRAQNRRIDIIILNTKYNSLENQLNDVPSVK